MREILGRLRCAVGVDELNELQRHACEIAATCRATFDVDPGIHLGALLSSSSDVAILIECTIVVHDNTPPHFGDTFKDFQKLLHRDRRLSHTLESAVFDRICADPSGLDDAISSVWRGYRRGEGGWKQLKEPNSRWLTSCTTPLNQNERAQQVHYNILQGMLLVDGKQLGRLPQDIVNHPTYKRIFGQVGILCNSVIEVNNRLVCRKFSMSSLLICLEWTMRLDLRSMIIRYIYSLSQLIVKTRCLHS